MSSRLSLGIPTKITLKTGEGLLHAPHKYESPKDRQIILKDISKYIDLSMYSVHEEKDSLILELKESTANIYLKDLVNDLAELLPLDTESLNTMETNSKETITIKNNITIKKDTNKNYHIFPYNLNEIDFSLYGIPWLFTSNDLRRNITTNYSKVIDLWSLEGKIYIEDESTFLKILNTITRRYFSNPLAKNLIFHIT